MTWFRRIRAGLKIALVVSLFWTAALILLRAGIGFTLGGLTVALFTEWFTGQILGILASGFALGALFATGLALTRQPAGERQISRGRAMGAGAIGGLLVALALVAYYGFSPYISFLWEAVIPVLAISSFGALTGFGVWRTSRHAESVAGGAPPDLLEP